MSIHTNEPQTGQDSSEGHRNPKAEAKASKAYAKAMRPWYKKKRVLIPAGLVALAMVGGATSSQNPESGSTSTTAVAGAQAAKSGEKAAQSEKKAGKSEKKAAKSEEKVAKVGETVTNAGTTYKVTTAKTTKEIGDPDFLGERADGVFVVVSLQLTNNK